MKNTKKGVLPLVGVLSVFALVAPVLTACATPAPTEGTNTTTASTETQPGSASTQTQTSTATSTEPVDAVPTIRWTKKVTITAGAEGTGTATEEDIATSYKNYDTNNANAHVTLGLAGSMKTTTKIKSIDSVTVTFTENSIQDSDGLGNKSASASLLLKTSFKDETAGPTNSTKTLVSGQKVEFKKCLPDSFELVYQNIDPEDTRNEEAKCTIESVIITYTEEERYGLKIDANASFDTYAATFVDGVYTRGDEVYSLTSSYNFKGGDVVAFKSPETKDARFDRVFGFDNVTFTGTEVVGHGKVGEDKYETIYLRFTNKDVVATIIAPEPIPYPADDFASVGKYDLYNAITGEKSVLETTEYGKVKFNDAEVGTFTDEENELTFSLNHEEKLTLTKHGNILVFDWIRLGNKRTIYFGAQQAQDRTIAYTNIAKTNDSATALTIAKIAVGEESKIFAANLAASGNNLIELDGSKITYTANNEDLAQATEIIVSEVVLTGSNATMTNVFKNDVFEDAVEGGKKYSVKLNIDESRKLTSTRRGNYAGVYHTADNQSTLTLDGFGNYDLDGVKGTHGDVKYVHPNREVVINETTYILHDDKTFEEYVPAVDTLANEEAIFTSDNDAQFKIVIGKGNVTVTDKYTGYKATTTNYTFKDDVYTFAVKVSLSEGYYAYDGNVNYKMKLVTSDAGRSLVFSSTVSASLTHMFDEYDYTSIDLYAKGTSFAELKNPFKDGDVFALGTKLTLTFKNGKISANTSSFDEVNYTSSQSYTFDGTTLRVKIWIEGTIQYNDYYVNDYYEFTINEDGNLVAKTAINGVCDDSSYVEKLVKQGEILVKQA